MLLKKDQFNKLNLFPRHYLSPRGVICRLCNKDRDQEQKGIGRYRSCSAIQYIGKIRFAASVYIQCTQIWGI